MAGAVSAMPEGGPKVSYAASTDVSADRSKAEIERLLLKYGATRFATGWDLEAQAAVLTFDLNRRRIRFRLSMPSKDDRSFWHTPATKERRSESAALARYEQAVRARWRSLVLALKAKLVAVDEGIETFEDAFLAYTVLPDNTTVGDWAKEQIETAYESGRMPELLPGAHLALPAPREDQ